MVGKTRRCVVILHPDFDVPGSGGIKDAQEFAQNLLAGQEQMIADAIQGQNQDPQKAGQIKAHAEKFDFLIRNIPEDFL